MNGSVHSDTSANKIESEKSPLLDERSTTDTNYQNGSPRRTGTGDQRQITSPISSFRRPVQYYSINADSGSSYDDTTIAAVNRYKYYNKLTPNPNTHNAFVMPEHVVPNQFFIALPVEQTGEQSSVITIFSIWNTMLGTSLLSMPWAFGQAGFTLGLCLFILMAGITLYTSYRVMKSTEGFVSKGEVVEFSDVCAHYLGRPGEYLAVFFSLSAFLGAMIVYWVLMSNFLYNTVSFIHDITTEGLKDNDTHHGVMCPLNGIKSSSGSISNKTHHHHTDSTYSEMWDQYNTVPFYLMVVLVPLIHIKSPTFFTKFNALGTISVVYLLIFISVKASQLGMHLDFNTSHSNHVFEAKSSFVAFTGTLSLAFYIHNAVVTIVRNQKYPENNGRDLTIAYICVTFTYMFVGIMFYSSFPFKKDCIQDNLLDNFLHTDTMAFVARLFLFMQMLTVFPLLVYIFRVQFMHSIFGKVFPSWKHVIALNMVLVGICLIFARFLPNIGEIISFTGAFCGLAYVFTLPCLVYMLSLKERGLLTKGIIALHAVLIVLGIGNFFGQILRQT